MTLIAKPNNKRCFAPCTKSMIESGQCTCNPRHAIIIGTGMSLGARGCSLLIYEAIALELQDHGIDIIELHDSLSRLKSISEKTANEFSELAKTSYSLGLSQMKNMEACLQSNDHKKQKYIRQQHKLAQRHYRRK